jgi:hypothetical protein
MKMYSESLIRTDSESEQPAPGHLPGPRQEARVHAGRRSASQTHGSGRALRGGFQHGRPAAVAGRVTTRDMLQRRGGENVSEGIA